jgi:hypothetical protein
MEDDIQWLGNLRETLKGQRDRKDRRAMSEQPERKEQRGQMVHKDRRAFKGQLARLAQPDRRAFAAVFGPSSRMHRAQFRARFRAICF